MDKLTIKEAAAALKCSHQTIRRRIANGELPAEKEKTGVGEVWFIPASAIQTATQTIEVVSVTRNIAPSEIGQLVENAVAKTVAAQVEPLKEEIRQLRAELKVDFARLDEKTQEVEKRKKSFLALLFGG